MDPVRAAATRHPEGAAVLDLPAGPGCDAPVWTWSELDAWVDAVAGMLEGAGIGPGDRVAMRLPPSPEAIALLHGTARVGATLVPLHTAWTEPEITKALAVVGAPALFISTVGEVVPWDGEGPPATVASGRRTPAAGAGPSAILLTSGTAGVPRPVPLRARNLSASAEGALRRLGLRPDDRWLAVLSPAHVGGFALIHRAAYVGCAVLPRPRFDAVEAAELVDAGMVTHASLVPVMLERLLAVRGDRPAPSTLRCLLLGGAATPRPLLDRALALRYPIALTYGLTEATSQVATASPGLVREVPGSVGPPLEGVELRIGRPDDEGVGEILVRGDTVVTGLPRMQASAGEGGGVAVDAEGWLHTGDLGRLDPEGHLWVTGRRSDRIVTGGVTVEPAEVEAVLALHPEVREVAVVGVPDAEWGERIRAVVVPRDPSAPPSFESLLALARPRLASAKRPRELRIVEALPRNANGKVLRSHLREEGA